MSREGAAAPDSVDIRAIQAETHGMFDLHQVLASEELLAGGRLVNVELRSVALEPKLTTTDGLDTNGSRLMCGVFVRSHYRDALVQLVRGPLQFSIDRWDYPRELRQEKRILELIGQAPVTSNIAGPIPGALQTNETVYESTAPGINLFDALSIVAGAYHNGELSEQETALLLTRMHTSSRQALANLHGLGIQHNHAHTRNFNVDITSGDATIFDYTIAVSKHADDTMIQTDNQLLTADNPERDIYVFEEFMQRRLNNLNLNGLAPLAEFNPLEMEAAIAKLQPLVIGAALRNIGIDGFSEEDVREIIAAQDRLIGIVPAIEYPKDTFGQRLKARLAAAKVAVQEFFVNYA